MALTRDFKDTVKARAERDPKFRAALLTEAVEQMLAGDMVTGKAVLRDRPPRVSFSATSSTRPLDFRISKSRPGFRPKA